MFLIGCMQSRCEAYNMGSYRCVCTRKPPGILVINWEPPPLPFLGIHTYRTCKISITLEYNSRYMYRLYHIHERRESIQVIHLMVFIVGVLYDEHTHTHTHITKVWRHLVCEPAQRHYCRPAAQPHKVRQLHMHGSPTLDPVPGP